MSLVAPPASILGLVIRRAFLLVFLPALLLVACGGSSSSRSTSTAPETGSSTSTAARAPSTGAGLTTASPSTATTSATGRLSGSGSASAPTGGAGLAGGGASGGGATNARVPASFQLGADGALDPKTISAPAFLAVALSITSTDSRPHMVLVRTPSPRRLLLVAHGHAFTLIGGLRAGTYPIEVDGAARGALMIGGEPGP